MKSKELLEERKKIWNQIELDVAKATSEGNRPLNAEERERFDKLDAEQARLKDEADGYERIEKFNASKIAMLETQRNAGQLAPRQSYTKQSRNDALRGFLIRDCDVLKSETPRWERYTEAADLFGMRGRTAMLQYDEAPLDSTVSTKGIETLNTTLAGEIYEFLKSYGGVFSVAGKFQTDDGGPFRIVTSDQTAVKGDLVDENAADNVTELTLGSITMYSYLYSSGIIKIPFEMIRDSKYPIQSWVASHAAEAMQRKIADVLLTGNGSGKPLGIFDATNGLATGVTTASTSTISYSELEEQIYKINPAYRSNAKWLWSDDFRRLVMTLTSGTIGVPLWQPSLIPGEPDKFRGYPVVIDYGMSTVGAGNTVAAFGDFDRAYKIRLVGNPTLAVSDQRYFEFRQVGVVYFSSLDATVVDNTAAKRLKMHA